MSGVIKLNAGNDTNGNPRRCYVVLGKNGLEGVYNDYYSDGDAKKHAEAKAKAIVGAEVYIKPAELKDLYKRAKAVGVYHPHG